MRTLSVPGSVIGFDGAGRRPTIVITLLHGAIRLSTGAQGLNIEELTDVADGLATRFPEIDAYFERR